MNLIVMLQINKQMKENILQDSYYVYKLHIKEIFLAYFYAKLKLLATCF